MNIVHKISAKKMNGVQHKNERRSKIDESEYLMAGKREAKKEELKIRLIEATRALIEEQGLSGLRARDIAEKAGCALGGLYTVFADIDELILHVNSRTLRDMQIVLTQKAENTAPLESVFRTLSLGYLQFALDHRNLWSALFEHRMPVNAKVPDWHLAEHEFLIGFIARPLAAAMPNASREEMALRARTLFASVHGVISMSLESRFVGLPPKNLEHEVGALADILWRGIA